MLYGYGLKLGVELLLKGKYRDAIRYLVIPVNYWRALEYRLVYDEGDFREGETVLDIGSPKLLSLFLAERTGARVFSTDIEDYFLREYGMIRDLRAIPEDRLQIQVEDGRSLTFPDRTFDKVYSLSVVEHIPGDGDGTCLKEVARVLSPGGRCVLTVPFAPSSRTEYRDDRFYWSRSSVTNGNGRVFYQRRYSEEDLYRRLIEPSGLSLKKLAYFGEKLDIGEGRELCQLMPRVTGPIQPMLSSLLHSEVSSSWQSMTKPLGALVVLEK